MYIYMSFPGGSDGKRVSLQCRRPRFDPWVKKIPWQRKWQPTLVFLPGKFHGWRNLVGYSLWGHKESDTTEQLRFHFSLSCTGEGNVDTQTPWAVWYGWAAEEPSQAGSAVVLGWCLGQEGASIHAQNSDSLGAASPDEERLRHPAQQDQGTTQVSLASGKISRRN